MGRIAVGSSYFCGISGEDNSLYCWGTEPVSGDLITTPQAVGGGPNAWSKVSVGLRFMCATSLEDGAAYCRGKSYHGELGDGKLESSSDVMKPVKGGQQFKDISSGDAHACGVTFNGEIYCWGDNDLGQLGQGNTKSSSSPVKVAGSSWESVSAGGEHTCAVKSDGSGWCWGKNDFHQVSPSSNYQENSPVKLNGRWRQLSAGPSFTLGIDSSGKGFGWGLSESITSESAIGGLLGDGKDFCLDLETSQVICDEDGDDYGFSGFSSFEQNPVPIVGGKKWSTLSAGLVPCGVESGTSKLYCWGYTEGESLADGSPNSNSPKLVNQNRWLYVSGGKTGARCAIQSSGEASCWGRNVYECFGNCPLGDGSTSNSATPKVVSSIDNWVSNGNVPIQEEESPPPEIIPTSPELIPQESPSPPPSPPPAFLESPPPSPLTLPPILPPPLTPAPAPVELAIPEIAPIPGIPPLVSEIAPAPLPDVLETQDEAVSMASRYHVPFIVLVVLTLHYINYF